GQVLGVGRGPGQAKRVAVERFIVRVHKLLDPPLTTGPLHEAPTRIGMTRGGTDYSRLGGRNTVTVLVGADSCQGVARHPDIREDFRQICWNMRGQCASYALDRRSVPAGASRQALLRKDYGREETARRVGRV